MASHKRSHEASAVVTGAGSGIGRAFALELAKRGGQVVAADIDPDAAAETVSQIEATGGRALAVVTDVSRETSVRELADAATSWFGLPSLVINNAGIGTGGGLIGDGKLRAWRRAIDVNLWGVIYGADVFTPLLRQGGRGGIINTASAAGFAAAPGMAPYNVSKAGVITLSETLAAELQRTSITVTVLCPTFVPTNIFDGELIDAASAAKGKRLAEKSKLTAEDIAIKTLDAHDRGRLYVLPQLDAKIVWRAKRLLPVAYMKAAGRMIKTSATGTASHAVR
ncbi:SDR family NAD(P)-dependent oxidoreductase [Streptomyces sp. NPDC046909]|uniref:SDR family NAD(P)-dependent oxidoreductase n=1 Tax=Streptomyces sp. NPDC046909 TaxID=3155617 RepID=UPI0033D58717